MDDTRPLERKEKPPLSRSGSTLGLRDMRGAAGAPPAGMRAPASGRSGTGGGGLRKTISRSSIADLAALAREGQHVRTFKDPKPAPVPSTDADADLSRQELMMPRASALRRSAEPKEPRAEHEPRAAAEHVEAIDAPSAEPRTSRPDQKTLRPARVAGASPPPSPRVARSGSPGLTRAHSSTSVDLLQQQQPKEGLRAVEQISAAALPRRSRSPSPSPAHRPALSVRQASPVSGPGASASRSAFSSAGVPADVPAGVSPASLAAPPVPSRANSATRADYHDDLDVVQEPADRVDYFSHDWSERDIAGSWKYVIARRQDMANSARLENASWRMWAKAKNNLRTADPSTVNWLKDYDVTWLYGPLYHEQPHDVYEGETPHGSPAPPVPEPHTVPTKSILKKKTLAQIMLEESGELELDKRADVSPAGTPQASPHVSPGSSAAPTPASTPAAEPGNPLDRQYRLDRHDRGTRTAANYVRHHLYRPIPQGYTRQVVADILNRQYGRHAPPRDSPLHSPLGSQISVRGFSRPASLLSMRSSSVTSITGERRVHFNDRVEQCMAVDDGGRPGLERDGSSSSDSDSEDEVADAGLFLGLRRPSAFAGAQTSMIAPLPATTLKYAADSDAAPATVVVGAPGSARPSRRPGFNAHYAPHPVQTYQIVDSDLHAVDIP